MQWYNEPPFWKEFENTLTVVSGLRTDFWRETHYGFIRDTGHFYYQEVTGDFIAEVKIIGEYQELYDQAGLMVRFDEKTWLKCGIEFVNNVQQVSAVVTRDFSDWSVSPLPQNPIAIWLQVKREGPAVEVHYSLDGESYKMLRLAYLTPAETLQVGFMCAAPEREGFSVTFERFQINSL